MSLLSQIAGAVYTTPRSEAARGDPALAGVEFHDREPHEEVGMGKVEEAARGTGSTLTHLEGAPVGAKVPGRRADRDSTPPTTAPCWPGTISSEPRER